MSDFAEYLRKAAEAEVEAAHFPASSVFAEEPVSLTIFVQDKAYLGNPALSAVQFDAVRHIERVYYEHTYPELAKEFEAGKKPGTMHVGAVSAWRDEPYWSQPLRMINFATIQWGKGSLSPLSEIYNGRTGQWVKLKDWNQQDLVAAVYPADGRVFSTAGTAAFREGYGAMYRVRTRKGLESVVWAGHRFLTWARRRWASGGRITNWAEAGGADWARLWDLDVGDPIAVTELVPEPTEPVTQPDRDVELVGLLIGNGSMTKNNGSVFTCHADAKLTQQRVSELFEQFPDTTVKSFLDTSDGSRRWRVVPKQAGTNHHSVAVREAAQTWGLAGKAAADKRVPDVYFRVPTRQVALLVSRLIDTDGWVSFSNTPEIGYSTISPGLAKDVHRLWLRLGVLAELKEKKTTCQNCGTGDLGHVSPHLSYQVRVRDAVGLERLASQLTLLDKDPQRQRVLAWAQARSGKVRARHGDLVWDRIEEITYLGDGDYWTLTADGPASYIADNGQLHHNSGKDHIARVSSMRIAYLLLCLRSPQDYFAMPEQDTIHLLNVASSSAQAQQAFFNPIVRAVKKGWFAGKCDPKQNVITYAKGIESISGHSDAETQEGLNLMLGIADEIDAFKSRKEMSVRRGASAREPTKSAEGILNMMRTSGSTRFPEVFKMLRISYPRYLGSTIQNLTEEARADIREIGIDSRHYVSGPLATWDVNPRVKGREAFAADYREDPVLARSKYECKPARAINPYFRNHQAVEACILRTPELPVEISYRIDDAGPSRVWIPQYSFSRDFYPVRGARYAMHADMAVTGDRAGIAMAHIVRWSEHETIATDEDGATHPVREVRPHVKVDFVMSYTSDPAMDPPREIQIRWARQLCFELIRRGFNIRRFTFDHFQSYDSMQILEAKGIESERVSTDLHEDPWRNLRDLLYEGRITIPGPVIIDDANPPVFLLRDELLSLTRMPSGRIDHPSDGCFTGETRIPLLDGTMPQIQDLEGQAVWVYSATPEGRIVPGWARARRTKVAKRLVDVVLDNGYTARCTPEHLWMLRDGSYKPAQQLVPGVDRLMPITRIWQDFRAAVNVNHKVCAAIPVELDHPVPVFDLEVDQWHNFALSGGVFVHNSKDEADALACAVLGAIAVGGAEEASGQRTYFSSPDFTVGTSFPMPLGVNMSQLWEREFPALY